MRTWKLFAILSAAALAAAGCQPPQPNFVSNKLTDELVEEAGQAVKQRVDESFGMPSNPVAWLRMPVDYGVIHGEVEGYVEDEDGPYQFKVALKVDDNHAEGTPDLDELQFSGLGVRWTSGQYQRGAEIAEGPQQGGYVFAVQVASFEPEEGSGHRPKVGRVGMLRLRQRMDPPPNTGDEFELIGYKLAHGRRLYAAHCQHCHGTSGDGNGPTARYLNPKPRDYRQGKFKFKSTLRNERPTDDDLKRTIRQGLPGTYMPSFLLLEDDELEAIVQYVKWLSMRGEYEIQLTNLLYADFEEQAFEDRLSQLQESAGETSDESTLREQLLNDPGRNLAQLDDLADTEAGFLREAWLRAREESSQIPPPQKAWIHEVPADAGPPAGSVTAHWSTQEGEWKVERQATGESEPSEVRVAELNDVGRFDGEGALERLKQRSDFAMHRLVVNVQVPHIENTPRSRARGRQLFIKNCAQCHGATGRGDGENVEAYMVDEQTRQRFPEPGLFDDWGNPISPRDLTSGIYRGGRRPVDLYRRVYEGINGTPMAPFKGKIPDAEIWDVVNYVFHLPFEEQQPATPSSPAEHRTAAAPTSAR